MEQIIKTDQAPRRACLRRLALLAELSELRVSGSLYPVSEGIHDLLLKGGAPLRPRQQPLLQFPEGTGGFPQLLGEALDLTLVEVLAVGHHHGPFLPEEWFGGTTSSKNIGSCPCLAPDDSDETPAALRALPRVDPGDVVVVMAAESHG